MKKLFTILIFFISVKGVCQYPITIKGNDPVQQTTDQGARASKGGFVWGSNIADTTTANTIPYLKGVPGLAILVNGSQLWIRNQAATTWVQIGGGAASANNGVSVGGGNVQIGGSDLIQYSAIGLNGFPLSIVHNGINNALQSDSNSLRLVNNMSAASSTDSLVSPSIVFNTNGWRISGGGSSKNERFRMDAIGGSGGSNGEAYWRLSANPNNTGYSTLYSVSTTGFFQQPVFKIFTINIGERTLNTGGSGSNLVFGNGVMTAIPLTGTNNIGIGLGALANDTSGNFNIAIGNAALGTNTTGFFNTALGHNTLQANTTGNQCVAVGQNSLIAQTTAIKNTAVGAGSMEGTTTGGFNTAVGEDAMLHNTTGANNSAIGWLAGSLNDIGSNNTSLGWSSARSVSFQNKSVFVGESSGYLTATGSNLQAANCYNCIAIGSNSYATADNQMRIGNDSLTAAYIYGVSSGAGTKTLRYDPSTKQLTYLDTTSAGVLWNNIQSPSGGDQNLTFSAGRKTSWINSNTTTDLFTIQSDALTTAKVLSLTTASTTLAAGNVLLNLAMSGINGTNGITATGETISVTNTNATSGTNVGLNVSASGATTGNYAIIVPSTGGRVGFGTSTPAQPVHVALPAVGSTSYMEMSSATASSFNTYFGTTAANQYAWFTNISYNGSVFVKDDATKTAWRMNQAVDVTDASSLFSLTYWGTGSPGTITTPFQITGNGGITTITPSATTGTTSSSGFVVSDNALSSGTLGYFASTSMTGGNLLQLSTNSTALAANNEALDVVMSGTNGTNAITATGIRSTVTNTNATSGTNVAANFNASGATTANWALFTGSATGGDGRINVNNAANVANQVIVVKSLTNTAGDGIVIKSNNETSNMQIGYQTIATNGGMIIQASSTGIEMVGPSGTGASISTSNIAPTSTLTVDGSAGFKISTTATSLSLDGTKYTQLVTATGQTITLPTAVGITGRIYVIKLTAAGTATVATTSSQNIDAATTYSLSAQYKYVAVQSDGTQWWIIANN